VITNPPEICSGATLNLRDPSIVTGSDTGLLYSFWLDAAATSAIPDPGAVTTGTYYLLAVNNKGCQVIKPVVVAAISSPVGSITVSGSPNACSGTAVTLTASEGQGYQWYQNDTAINGATARSYSATVNGNYTVVINDGTCQVQASNVVRVRFQECIPVRTETSVIVPTAFTPNKNGANDVLRPLLQNIASLRYFRVYNRWGQMVFQTNVISKGWDGTINGVPQPTETYTWILECTDNDGNIIKKSGRSLLIR
jgi:gliding motility-associated-like protein